MAWFYTFGSIPFYYSFFIVNNTILGLELWNVGGVVIATVCYFIIEKLIFANENNYFIFWI